MDQDKSLNIIADEGEKDYIYVNRWKWWRNNDTVKLIDTNFRLLCKCLGLTSDFLLKTHTD